MNLFLLAPAVLVRPIEVFMLIKRTRKAKNFSFIPAVTLLLLAVIVKVAYIYICHFPLNPVNPWDVNLIIEIAWLVVPVLSWVIANFLLLTVLNGECKFGEILTATAYSIMPYIVFTIPLALLSHFLSLNQAWLYNFINICLYIWMGILFFTNVKVMNNYSFWEALFMCFITICGIILLWLIMVLVFALSNQFIQFIIGLIREIRISFFM